MGRCSAVRWRSAHCHQCPLPSVPSSRSREHPQNKGHCDFGGQAPANSPTRCHCKALLISWANPPQNRLLLQGLALGQAEINQAAEDKRPFTAPPSIDRAPLANRPALAICPASPQAAIWPTAKQTEGPAGCGQGIGELSDSPDTLLVSPPLSITNCSFGVFLSFTAYLFIYLFLKK